MHNSLIEKGRFKPMKNAERKHSSLLANLGDINRPLRVRPVRIMGRDWWAIDAEDTWLGMVMDLRRLGYESMAWEDEVLVREGSLAEPQMEGPAAPQGLKPFPIIQPTIQIQKEALPGKYSPWDTYQDEEDFTDEEDLEAEIDEQENEDLSDD